MDSLNEKTVLALDLSTTCTGWALFGIETKDLLTYDRLKPKVPGKSKLPPLVLKFQTMLNLAEQIKHLVDTYKPHRIIIEEVTSSKNFRNQKTLDGFHWIVLYTLRDHLNEIDFYDVGGTYGWRTHLRLKYNDADKLHNKEAKKLNKTLQRGQKINEITKKTLAARHANYHYGTDLDVDLRASDADVADAICIGDAYLKYRLTPPR